MQRARLRPGIIAAASTSVFTGSAWTFELVVTRSPSPVPASRSSAPASLGSRASNSVTASSTWSPSSYRSVFMVSFSSVLPERCWQTCRRPRGASGRPPGDIERRLSARDGLGHRRHEVTGGRGSDAVADLLHLVATGAIDDVSGGQGHRPAVLGRGEHPEGAGVDQVLERPAPPPVRSGQVVRQRADRRDAHLLAIEWLVHSGLNQASSVQG